MTLAKINKIKPKKTVIPLSLIVLFGLAVRFYYVPTDLPIVSDGFFDFVYATKTVFEGSLPIGYGTTNTGWANFLSLFFSLYFILKLRPTKIGISNEKCKFIILYNSSNTNIFFKKKI